MEIRRTEVADVERVLEIYDVARRFMRAHGNLTQWGGGYPSREVILNDIASGVGYVVVDDGSVVGAFVFRIGEDPTYDFIEGQWPPTSVYGTIHRIATDGSVRGVADCALSFCRAKGYPVRVDTHADNTPMLNWITSRGFTYCGIIYVADGTPRKAFQLEGV